MSEKAMRKRVTEALKGLHAVPVENPARPGTPDVNFINGWIELKKLDRWPKIKPDDPVLLDHFTPQQRIWAQQRHRAGGNVWLLLQVGNEFLLFTGCFAAESLGRASKSALLHGAIKHWPKGFVESELIECLMTATT